MDDYGECIADVFCTDDHDHIISCKMADGVPSVVVLE